MAKTILSLLTFFTFFELSGQQKNLVIFTQENIPFYVLLNDIRQNETPHTNIKIKNIKSAFLKVKVLFQDNNLDTLNQSINSFKEDIEMEIVFHNDKYHLRYEGEASLYDTQIHDKQESINYRSSEDSTSQNNTTKERTSSSQINTNRRQTEKKSIVKQTAEEAIEDIKPNENYVFLKNGFMCDRPTVNQEVYLAFKTDLNTKSMSDKEQFILDFFKANCMTSAQIAGIVKMDYSKIKPYEIARIGYRYTWDTENYGFVVASLKKESDQKKLITFLDAGELGTAIEQPSMVHTDIPNQQTEELKQKESLINNYTGGIGCPHKKFVNALELKSKVDKKTTSIDKMELIRTATQNKCLNVAQVKTLASTFMQENTRLDFVEWAYHHTYDIADYHLVFKEFVHGYNKDKLSVFILEQPQNLYGIVKTDSTGIIPSNYSGEIGSSDPILNTKKVADALKEQVFKKDKFLILNHVLKNQALTVQQFKELANDNFTSENDILDFAEIAYPKIYDRDDFHSVKEIFTFNSSKRSFDELLEK